MARKPKKADDSTSAQSNELTDEEQQTLFLMHKREYEAALAAKKKADAEFKNTCKLAKSELGKHAVAMIKDAIALETEAGEEDIQADIERKLKVARWMAVPLGSQMEMFEDRTPAVDRAKAEGLRDGKAGKPFTTEHQRGTEQFEAYSDGYAAGQKAIFAIQRKEDAELFEEEGDGDDEAGNHEDEAGGDEILGDQQPSYEEMA